MICNVCPRKCNVDRSKNFGYCKSPEHFRLARAALHYWEEPVISGDSGSGTIFFSGCNLGCVFCQNREISHENKGIQITDDRLIEICKNLIDKGANNINLVNPTHYALRLVDVFSKWDCPVPIVYNSSGYESVETLKELDGLVDVYLPDYKYIRNDKALRYCKASDYPEIALQAIKEMKRQQPIDSFNNDSIMQKGVIIRHLILPSNTNSSIEILQSIKTNFGNSFVSLMAQYIPCGNLTQYSEINRTITKREYQKVLDYAQNLGLENMFIQELTSADEKYIPTFDFDGVL